jgi:proline dehydrogenase
MMHLTGSSRVLSSYTGYVFRPHGVFPIPSLAAARFRDQHVIGKRRRLQISEQSRQIHSQRPVSTVAPIAQAVQEDSARQDTHQGRAMQCLPWSTLLRSYLITWITSNKLLLRPSLAILGFIANSRSRIFNPDKNRILHALLKKTFYAHFCAGETPSEVRQVVGGLKQMGYQGVMMGHAQEEVLTKEQKAQVDSLPETPEQEVLNNENIQRWRHNTLATLDLSEQGDFVCLKFTGAGKQALKHLKQRRSCVPALAEAIHDVCQHAQKRGVGLLFDAEQAYIQEGIEDWTLHYMKIYNKGERAVVYGTYQAYAKRTPGVLAHDLDLARKENFVLGVKLVRGAYINSDPRELFWDTIEETHACYNNIARCMVEQRYDGILQPVSKESAQFPKVDFVLASHNAESVSKIRKLRDQQRQADAPLTPLAYGQLMGMADHVSCDLLQEARTRKDQMNQVGDIPRAFKYVVWGTMGECIKYLFRRAQENKDAVSRTLDARKALGKEISRRLRPL